MKAMDMLQKRGEIVNSMTAMLEKASGEGRDLTVEESSTYDAMDTEQTGLKNQADRILKHDKLKANLEAVSNESYKAPLNTGEKDSKFGKRYGKSFYDMLRVGRSAAAPEVLNALQVGTTTEGGFITPESFETALVMAMQDMNELRQYANVITTESTRNIPVESSLGTATWTAEEAAFTESDPAFAQVVLGAHKLSTITKVSEELLQDSFFDIESYLAMNFGKRFGIAEEAAFVDGDGSGKPTGILSGSTLGVTTAGATAITADEIIDLYHSLLRPYRANAVFLMNDSTAKLVRKLKDGNGDYLWQPGLQAGQPDTIFGRPVIASAAMPAATTGLKSMVFGDMSYYTVADRRGTSMQRLNELYAANGQVGFRAYKRVDAKVVLGAAIKHMIQL